MDCKLTSAFNYSVERMLIAMAGSGCRATDRCDWDMSGAMAGIVHLRGGLEGRVTLCFPVTTARRLVAEMLGLTPEGVARAMVQDGIAEMANIVAGNAKALLADSRHRFDISLPAVLVCREADRDPPLTDRTWARHYSTAFGAFTMSLRLLEFAGLQPPPVEWPPG